MLKRFFALIKGSHILHKKSHSRDFFSPVIPNIHFVALAGMVCDTPEPLLLLLLLNRVTESLTQGIVEGDQDGVKRNFVVTSS